MSRFSADKLNTLQVYTPGEQPADYSEYIKLNTNELPYPPSQHVIEAVNSGEVSKLNLYPPLECGSLKDKLSSMYGLKDENIFLSNGSDEILSFCFSAFCSDGAPVAYPDITYGFYKVYAQLYGSSSSVIALKSDFSVNVQDYIAVNKTIVLANPNAPTGLFVPVSDIRKIIESNQNNVIIIDEAYIDFGGESCAGLIKEYDNLLVIQTFSKSRALAGGRLGFALGGKELIDDLNKLKYSTNPYNINRLTYVAGEAAIDDSEYFMNCCNKVAATRSRLLQELRDIGFTVTDSKANFVFAKPCGITAEELYTRLKDNGVLIRYFSQDRISDYVRISIGTEKQTDILIENIKNIVKESQNAQLRDKPQN